ncbi:virulence protein E [Echinicola soli]|uniref:Virulence protein E n=1 Tax=Echinicola soli TaxID=2591634 RepID=A0A514CDH5_9BACT|nr:VapE domain-containing protein [Echinicola soli]QDH77867.1 virulence protein E [Echinicola soli]
MRTHKKVKDLDGGSNSSTVRMIKYLMSKYDFINNVVLNEVFASEKETNPYHPVNPNTLYIEARAGGYRTSEGEISSFLSSDYIPSTDPFVAYFEKHKELWNQAEHGDYIARFASYIHAEDQDRFNVQFKKWLVRCVACSIRDDYYNKQAFIFIQDKQNTGKTTLTRFLVPPELREYYAENISVDKDSLIALCQNFGIIQDELSTLSRAEINAQKTLMSKSTVKVRHPYDRKAKMEPRRASIWGSTNKAEFLIDETGSVRWLCFPLKGIDWDYKKDININIVWSQAYQLLHSGYRFEMTREEIEENERANVFFSSLTVEFELVQKYLVPGTKEDPFMTASDIVTMLTGLEDGKVRISIQEVGKALKRLGFEQCSKRGHHSSAYPRKGYYVKVENQGTTYYKGYNH